MSRAAASASPRCSSIRTAVQKAPMGLAIPLPIRSKPEPWIGSNIEGALRSGARLPVAPMPRLPLSAEARSDNTSACRLVASTVSTVPGRSTMRMVMASTSIQSTSSRGKSFTTERQISSHNTMPWRCALDLVTMVSLRRGRDMASSQAKRAMRSTPARVNTETSMPTSIGSPRWARPPAPAYSPSLFSRTITQSISRPSSGRRGPAMLGSSREGRTLAYWSRPWQMARRNSQRVMWSGICGSPTAPK